jgi:outer membrane lipoprotein-sorting protein
MTHQLVTLMAVWMIAGSTSQTAVQDPAQRGLAIAQEAERRYRGYVDSSAALTMVLRNSRGQESRRTLRIESLEVAGDGDKSLCLFDSPADVKGTALLTYAHKTQDDDQWLYLPAVKRVKRIASSNRSGSFVGSEFAYEDLASQEIEKYSHRYLRDEAVDGNDCFVLSRVPVDPKTSGYSRQEIWIDQAEYRTLKVEYFGRNGSLLKTLTASAYLKLGDRFWRPTRMTMVNHQTDKSTDLIWSELRLGTHLPAADFLKENLERAR